MELGEDLEHEEQLRDMGGSTWRKGGIFSCLQLLWQDFLPTTVELICSVHQVL